MVPIYPKMALTPADPRLATKDVRLARRPPAGRGLAMWTRNAESRRGFIGFGLGSKPRIRVISPTTMENAMECNGILM